MGLKDKIIRKQVDTAIRSNCDWFEHEGEEYVKLEQLKDWLVKDMNNMGKNQQRYLKGGFRR